MGKTPLIHTANLQYVLFCQYGTAIVRSTGNVTRSWLALRGTRFYNLIPFNGTVLGVTGKTPAVTFGKAREVIGAGDAGVLA